VASSLSDALGLTEGTKVTKHLTYTERAICGRHEPELLKAGRKNRHGATAPTVRTGTNAGYSPE